VIGICRSGNRGWKTPAKPKIAKTRRPTCGPGWEQSLHRATVDPPRLGKAVLPTEHGSRPRSRKASIMRSRPLRVAHLEFRSSSWWSCGPTVPDGNSRS
jgi:hypothetical protein